MKKIRFKTVLFLILLVSSTTLFSQQYRLGGSAIYSFTTRGFGLGLRGEFPVERIELLEGISIVPQLSFFPSFNRVTDFYIGSSAHLYVYKYDKWMFYALINASYRAWNIRDESDPSDDYANFAIEAGIGVTRNTCLRPFMEFRINAVGAEPNLRIGILYTFNCDIRGAVPCPKIPPQPVF